jgi:hypothetical protein
MVPAAPQLRRGASQPVRDRADDDGFLASGRVRERGRAELSQTPFTQPVRRRHHVLRVCARGRQIVAGHRSGTRRASRQPPPGGLGVARQRGAGDPPDIRRRANREPRTRAPGQAAGTVPDTVVQTRRPDTTGTQRAGNRAPAGILRTGGDDGEDRGASTVSRYTARTTTLSTSSSRPAAITAATNGAGTAPTECVSPSRSPPPCATPQDPT